MHIDSVVIRFPRREHGQAIFLGFTSRVAPDEPRKRAEKRGEFHAIKQKRDSQATTGLKGEE